MSTWKTLAWLFGALVLLVGTVVLVTNIGNVGWGLLLLGLYPLRKTQPFNASIRFVKKIFKKMNLEDLHWPTEEKPVGLGPISTIIITGLLAIVSSAGLASLMTGLAVWSGGLNAWSGLSWSLWLLLTVGTALLLLSNPRTMGPERKQQAESKSEKSVRMLPVPVNFAAIPTWINARFKRFFFTEGALWVPWWLGFNVSTAPVSETKIQFHDAQGQPLPEENRGHFRQEEALGYVFIGKRTIQEVVLVQAADLIVVTADANGIIQVENPIRWQGADNPYGTVIGRLEASLRTAIARFHAEDTNAVRSLFPSLLLGSTVMYIKCRDNRGPFVKGDLIQDETGERIVDKTKITNGEDGIKKKVRKTTKQQRERYLAKANAEADNACKPTGGFTIEMVQELEVSEEYLIELEAYGGAKRHMAIKDISLPKSIEDAAAIIAKERRERVAEVIQAQTAKEVAGIHKSAIDEHGHEAAQMAMIDREKATAVAGWGNNPLTQAIAAFKGGNS